MASVYENDALTAAAKSIERVIESLTRIVLGKEGQIRLCLACVLAGGHLLIEDIPGVGKTTLAHALAAAMGLSYQRIQFTSDLLPADIIGASVFERETGRFKFHPGPVFAQLILADEVNRATPKTQSALLEAMEEHQVTTDTETRPLPEPFFVIATQNPAHQIGTYPLPESQLDRFLMRLQLGYPDAAAERALFRGADRRELLQDIAPSLDPDRLRELQIQARSVHVSDALLDYIQALIRHTRESNEFVHGLSPRAGLALIHAGQAWTLIHGRSAVLPEDIQAVLPGVVEHRLQLRSGDADSTRDIGRRLMEAVPLP